MYKKTCLLIFVLSFSSQLSAQTLAVSRWRAGAAYAFLLGELRNHFHYPRNYSVEGEAFLKKDPEEASPWSLPFSLSFMQLYSDDVRASYVSQAFSLRSGLAYRFQHESWLASRLSLGLSASVWKLSARDHQIQMTASQTYTVGLYTEFAEEFWWNQKWGSSFFLRSQYPEVGVYSLIFELGFGLIYVI